ncbi:MAG: transcriptional repressor [Puniceicoccales bacterium]|jgi:Fe2+ or Zn2+ uptake regulation protein|nr:transcriptional repressor [Puniceicoccales bacterium]
MTQAFSSPAAPQTPVPAEVSLEKSRETFRTFLAAKRLRVTNQRMAIFDAAFQRQDHFTAEALLNDARTLDDSVSRATVYRSLPILVENGIVREVDIGHDQKYYTTTLYQSTFQAQLVCLDCDKIIEMDAPFMEWYGKTVASKNSMELASQRLQLTARCKRNACENMKKRAS